ncbi:hypothetical protein JCM5350_002446 [Sporobolomyces pararoseus]
MNDQSPPGYTTSTLSNTNSSSVLLNLSPPQESTTFQLGYLGHGQAFIAGEIQVKYAGSEEEERPHFSKLVIIFRGIERVEGSEAIELCEQKEVVWGEGAAGSSTSTSITTTSAFPPTNSPFKLRITPDLPVCLHLGSSSLEYSLHAELHFSDTSLAPIVRCAPVHLARTSPPGSSLSDFNLTSPSGTSAPSTTPSIASTEDPLPFSIKLPRTVFRRGEPVELLARIEVPTAQAVRDGLRLRTVSAELSRTIKVNSVSSGSTASALDPGRSHRTVLAHSGKSARFSPNRPIVIKLTLHPPMELSCESITQSTILHSVTFAVTVTVGLFNINSTSNIASSTDAVLSQSILIVPPTPTLRTDKQKEVERELEGLELEDDGGGGGGGRWSFFPPPAVPLADSPGEGIDGPVPSYVEHGADDPGIAAVASTSDASLLRDLEEDGDEEYDGYEELSIPIAEAGPPPPAIDDDVSPPSPSEPTHPESFRLPLGEDPPPNEFGIYAGSQIPDSNLSLAPLSSAPSSPEPSSPPPPLSPLSISNGNYPLPSLAPPIPSLPHQPNSQYSTVPDNSSPSLFSEYLPPPYIGSNSMPSAPPGSLQPRDNPLSPTLSSRASTPSSSPPLLSINLESSPFSTSSISTEARGGGDRRPSESLLLRDPPPYEVELTTGSREPSGEVRRVGSFEEGEGEYEFVRFGVNRRGELVL